jgi:hypothetical protein
MVFTWLCEHQTVARSRRRYGAIVWYPGVAIDEAIRLVKAADDPDEAMSLVARACAEDQRWAVIDLTTMNVVASGPSSTD